MSTGLEISSRNNVILLHMTSGPLRETGEQQRRTSDLYRRNMTQARDKVQSKYRYRRIDEAEEKLLGGECVRFRM